MIWLFLLAATDDGREEGTAIDRKDSETGDRDETRAGDLDKSRTGDPGDRVAVDAQVDEARRKLQEAIEKTWPERPRRQPQVGQKVDKYFGEKLPPVCERLGCYLTDDGKRFYCVNPTCQKHRKRETKHTRIAKKRRDRPMYFRCPRCDSRHIDLLMFTSQYECRRCNHKWDRDMPTPPKKD